MNTLFSDLCFPSPEFQVRCVAFDGTDCYIFIFDTICSPKLCQHFLKGRFVCTLQPTTVLNFSYLAIKLPNFKPVDEKLPKLEPRMSHSFDIKTVSRKNFKKFLCPLKPTSGEMFLFQNLVLYMTYHNNFFADLKLYL